VGAIRSASTMARNSSDRRGAGSVTDGLR
jgi:hypothetical protein